MDRGQIRAVERLDVEPARESTWGEKEDREFVAQLAEDMATRSGFTICVVEVVRGDSKVECIAAHGSPRGEVRHVGDVRELAAVRTTAPGFVAHGKMLFLPVPAPPGRAERGDAPKPQLRTEEECGLWVSGDRVMARLRDEHREVRALVQLGRPLDNLRPKVEDLRALEQELDLSFRALVVSIQHERLTQQVRMERAVRRVLRAAGNDTAPDEILHLVHAQMREGFRATALYIDLYGAEGFPSPAQRNISEELFGAFLDATRRAWERDDIIIIEDGQVWGDEILQRAFAEEIGAQFAAEEIDTVVLVPVGDGATLLGSMTIVRSPDSPRWTESEGAAALDAGRDLGHAICNARAFESEQQLNGELRRLDTHRTRLIATLSHELRNPTGVILGHLEMLREIEDLDPEVRHSLKAVERGARRIDALSHDLLVLRTLEDPNHPLERQEIDLGDLLDEVVELADFAASQADVTLQVRRPGEPVLVSGNPAELTNVITNLVSNAVKYSNAGGVVLLTLERDGECVVLTCTDDGIGISEEDRAKLFREFFRSTNFEALRRPGNGLGLSIVRRIVARHEGTIEVQSALGKGTTFRLNLPAC